MNPKLFTIHQVEKDDIELYSMNEWLRALKTQMTIYYKKYPQEQV